MLKPDVKVGQVWRDRDRRYGERFIRIDRIEQRGLWRIARVSSRYTTCGEFIPTTRFVRLDRIPKNFRLMKDPSCSPS